MQMNVTHLTGDHPSEDTVCASIACLHCLLIYNFTLGVGGNKGRNVYVCGCVQTRPEYLVTGLCLLWWIMSRHPGLMQLDVCLDGLFPNCHNERLIRRIRIYAERET